MELNEYQNRAMQTCMSTSDNLLYMLTNLMGEVGEFAGKIAKHVRKGQLFVVTTDGRDDEGNILHSHVMNISDNEKMDLAYELGDCLWQLAGLCHVMGISLDRIAILNLEKLASRKRRGVIDGSGDER